MASEALKIFGIPRDAAAYQRMNTHIIHRVAWSFARIAEVLQGKGTLK